jgi:hypothetical protein
MEAFRRLLADICAIVDDGGEPESIKLRIGRVLALAEREAVAEIRRGELRPPASGCRTCGASQRVTEDLR